MRSSQGKIWILVLLASLTFPALAHSEDGRWLVGLGGSAATSYAYRTLHFSFGHIDEDMGATFMGTGLIARRVGSILWLETTLDYSNQMPRGSYERAEIACSAIGIRALSTPRDRSHFYVELLPALYGGRWRDELHDYSISSLRPGLVGGLGVLGDLGHGLHLDVILRRHVSTAWPELHTYNPADTYHGLERTSVGARILYAL